MVERDQKWVELGVGLGKERTRFSQSYRESKLS